MKLKRMTANFGRLDHETLVLEEGLNILTLPNEGGKSTWCAFLRVMLYGLNTRERDKKGFLADKTRYLPWDGGAMEGELLCSWQGRDLLVRRFTKGSTPMGGFEAIWADTGEPVSGLNADNLGDILIGVSRGVYERSAFLGQASLPVSQTPELEKRLSALVSSGEEDVSPTEVRDSLEQWQRKLEFRGKGIIPDLEALQSALSEKLTEVNDATGKIRTHQTEIDRLEELRGKLSHQVDLHRAYLADAQAQAYEQAEREMLQTEGFLRRLEEQLPRLGNLPSREVLEQGRDEGANLRGIDGQLRQAQIQLEQTMELEAQAEKDAKDPWISGTAEEVRTRCSAAVDRYRKLDRERRFDSLAGFFVPVFLLLGAAAVVWMSFAWYQTVSILGLALTGGQMLLAIIFSIILSSGNRKCRKQMEDILDEFHVDDLEKLPALVELYAQKQEDLRLAGEATQRQRLVVEELTAQHNGVLEELRTLVGGFAPEVKEAFGFAAAIARALTLLDAIDNARRNADNARKVFEAVAVHGQGRAETLAERPSITMEQAEAGLQEAQRRIEINRDALSMAVGRRSTLGDPESLQAELEDVERRLEHHRADYAALSAALTALEEAEADLRERFSPRLNRIAGDYFSRLTDGKYEKVRISRYLETGAEEVGAVAPRESLSLSQGTVDQLWLAVRLAVCDLAMPEEDLCPLVLDDAMVNFDDARLVTALKLLAELAQKRQVLLFSCHDRERELFQRMQAEGGTQL